MGPGPDIQSDLARLVVAVLVGAAVGAERTYRSKAAGLRTMALICLGSAVFTILSLRLGAGGTPDRIASNIITGIGFLGAGVIFKDSLTVSGLTTATSSGQRLRWAWRSAPASSGSRPSALCSC